MSETFHILVKPPKAAFKSTVKQAYDTLQDFGWNPSGMFTFAQKPRRFGRVRRGDVQDSNRASSDDLLKAYSGEVGFGKEARWLSLGAGSHLPNVVEIASDATFFEAGGGSAELSELLTRMQLPLTTVVIGDVEGIASGVSPRQFRVDGFPLHWISHFFAPTWSILKSIRPPSSGRVLTQIGETYVVALYESPYLLDERHGLPALARKLDLTRVRRPLTPARERA